MLFRSTVGPHSDADDATLTPEISELGARIRIAGVREEEAACGQGRAEIVCSLDELAAIAETLTTGRDTTRTVTAWGRAYRSTWSLSGPSDLFEDGRQIWFYPMDQERYTLRILAAPLRAALEGLVTWLEVAAPGLPAADQEAVRRARGWLGGEPTRSPG